MFSILTMICNLLTDDYQQLEAPVLKFSGPEKLGRTEYFQHLRNAKFCLAPRGESSWTLRFYESYFVVSLSLSLNLSIYLSTCPPTNVIYICICRIRNGTNWLTLNIQFFFSYFQECVPVILSDQAELPFQNVIDYTQISIKWPASRIGPELFEYLESIPG